MATFLRSLPPGSPVRSLSKAAATDFLTSQHIVRGIPGDTVALRREWCGAVLWIEAHPLLTLEDITSLSNLLRETLCCLLEVASDGTISQKSRRLYRAIKGPPRDTFLDLMVGTCPELSAVIVTMVQAQRRLRNVSFNWDPADLAEAREACAPREWLLTVCLLVDDLKALSSYLLDRTRMVHGVNRQWHFDVVTQSILTMVNVWRSTIIVVRPALPAAAGGGGAGFDGVVANRLAPLGDGGDGGAVHVGVRAGNQQPPSASIIAPALVNAVPPPAANVAAPQQPPMYGGAPLPAGAVQQANHGFSQELCQWGGGVPNPQHHMGPWPGALLQYPPPYGQHPFYYGHQPQQQPPPPPPPPPLLPQYGEAGGSGAGTAAGSAAGPLVSFL